MHVPLVRLDQYPSGRRRRFWRRWMNSRSPIHHRCCPPNGHGKGFHVHPPTAQLRYVTGLGKPTRERKENKKKTEKKNNTVGLGKKALRHDDAIRFNKADTRNESSLLEMYAKATTCSFFISDFWPTFYILLSIQWRIWRLAGSGSARRRIVWEERLRIAWDEYCDSVTIENEETLMWTVTFLLDSYRLLCMEMKYFKHIR